jgi:hypothetical protein
MSLLIFNSIHNLLVQQRAQVEFLVELIHGGDFIFKLRLFVVKLRKKTRNATDNVGIHHNPDNHDD